MVTLISIPSMSCNTTIPLPMWSLGSQLLELLTCTNKGGLKFKVIQKGMKCVQVYACQLTGIFHTVRGERFNNTISVNLLKFVIIYLELKNKKHYQATVLNIHYRKISIHKSPGPLVH